MKSFILPKYLSAIVTATVLVFAVTTSAEDCDKLDRRADQHHQRLEKFLSLNSDQSDQVREVMLNQHERIKDIRDDTDMKLSSILSSEQMDRFAALNKVRKEHRRYNRRPEF